MMVTSYDAQTLRILNARLCCMAALDLDKN